MTIQEMIKKFDISIVRAGVHKGKMKVAKGKKATQKELKEIKENKEEIMKHLEEKHIADMKAMREKEEEKELEIERKRQEYLDGKEIEMVFEEGEHLSGHRIVDSIAGELLEELGLAHYVEGWGYLAHSELENLEVATIENATSTKKEAEETIETLEEDIEKENIEQAKVLGHKVEIYRMTTECNGSASECDMGLIVGYIDRSGEKSHERIHLH